MAHHTTQRRILASPEPPPPPNPSSMDPTLKKQNKPSSRNPDHHFPSKPFYMSNPLSKLSHRITHKSINNPPSVDTHLQAKSMTVSADFDASRLSSTKPKHQQQRRLDKEKVKKSLVEKKKVGEVKVKEKKKEVNNTSVEDDNKEVKDLLEGLDIKRMTVPMGGGGGGGRRRSFGGSPVELADFLANNGAKIVAVDMAPFMQIHAVDCARKTHDSLEKFTSKTLALTLKKEFDGVYGPAWHCIVGTSFGSFVTHSVGGFLYFSMDQKVYVLLFKTTVQRAD
ncbi:uncharacterized protein [Euphorbia lathyris]|uniref:uncharacterized protein n=1 Tax=Euphorbia lathyris TaxID=212925 RepID=UPI0033135B7D